MTIEKIKQAYEMEPFQPFVLHLADGREIPVLERQLMIAAPSGRTIFVVQPDDRFHILDLLLVTDLEFKPSAPRKNGKKRHR